LIEIEIHDKVIYALQFSIENPKSFNVRREGKTLPCDK
jgi:hypothetical protein